MRVELSPPQLCDRGGRVDALLREWNPVGGSGDDVIFIMGVPHERSDERIVYLLGSSGSEAVYWHFFLDDGGVVTSVDRRVGKSP